MRRAARNGRGVARIVPHGPGTAAPCFNPVLSAVPSEARMNRLPLRPLALAALCLAGLSPRPAAAADAAPAKILPLPYEQRTLENGLRVIVVRTDTPGVVSVQIPMQTGSRNEVEEGKTGFAHFFEHMMFRGTPAYPADAYSAVIKNAGADQNAYTSSDLTNYYTNFTTADLEKVLEVEADRFRNLAYSEEQFRTEALAVKGEYLKNFSNPLSKGFERLADLAYDRHPYGHTTMGYLADIEAMPQQMEYAKTFFQRWYRPEYASVIVVGDVDPAKTLAMVEKHWGGWQRGDYSVAIPTEPPLPGPRYEHLKWEGPTLPYLLNAWRGPAFGTDDRETPALMLLGEIYFGPTSDVYQQLVVRERLVDQFFAQPPLNVDPGLFTVGSRLTDARHAPAVVAAIRDTLLRARTEPLDPAKLAEAKSRVKYAFANTLNSAAPIAATLARFVSYERDIETLNRLYAQFDQVTPQDIVAAAEAVFTDRNRASLSISNEAALVGADGFGSLDEMAAAAKQRAAAPSPIPLLEQRSDSPLIDVALIFHTGAAFDPPGKKGLAWLTAAMLANGGTAKRSYAELQQAFYPMASGLGAQVDKEMVKLAGTVHRDNLAAWHGLVREMLLQPGFREDDFKRLKQLQLNAIRVDLRSNNDEELGKEALYEMVYGAQHPYGSLNAGHLEDVESITLDDVRAFHAAHFGPQRLRVGLAGGYDDAFRDRLLADLRKLPPVAKATLDAPAATPADARRARIVRKETQAVAVSFGWPIDLKRGDADWLPLWLVRSYLGEHRNSSALLYNKIREQRGMNYGNYAYIEYFPFGGFLMQPNPNYARDNDLFQVWLRPLRDNNDALFATRAALHELDKLVQQGMSADEFEASRSFLRKFVAILTASSTRRLGYGLDSQWFGTPEFIDYVRQGLDAMTLEQVNAAIRRHMHPDQAQFVFVAKDAEGLKRALASDAPSPVAYNTPKPKELTDEDAIIAKAPLGLPAARIEVIDAERVFE
jgi:zinc protease